MSEHGGRIRRVPAGALLIGVNVVLGLCMWTLESGSLVLNPSSVTGHVNVSNLFNFSCFLFLSSKKKK